jgi:pyochelin biosynthetic protein PchC
MTKWLQRHTRPEHPRLRLVCFPHAGGSASFYRPWQTLVPPEVELVAVQYPGRHDRFDEPTLETMDDLVGAALPDLEGLGDRPAVFLGHSMGAAVAYEAILRLSWRPRLLVASACAAPSVDCRSDRHLDSDAELIAALEPMGGFYAEVLADEDLRELFMPALRGDCRLIQTYLADPDRRIDVPILAAVGDRDVDVSIADARAWQDATTAGCTLAVFAGDHFYLSRHAHTLIKQALAATD